MHFQPDQGTLLAVVVGALLATVGGFAEGQLEGVLRRRERERSSALMFGEVLTVLKAIMRLADEARGRGDPYGPVTMRLLRAARRETDIYDRNRETLFDLRDPAIRARIHTLVARVTFALDGVTDMGAEIASVERLTAGLAANDPGRADVAARLAALNEDRRAAFDFAMETVGQIDPLLAALTPLARHRFLEVDPVLRNRTP